MINLKYIKILTIFVALITFAGAVSAVDVNENNVVADSNLDSVDNQNEITHSEPYVEHSNFVEKVRDNPTGDYMLYSEEINDYKI